MRTVHGARSNHAAVVQEFRGAIKGAVPEEQRAAAGVGHPVVWVHCDLAAVALAHLAVARAATVGHPQKQGLGCTLACIATYCNTAAHKLSGAHKAARRSGCPSMHITQLLAATAFENTSQGCPALQGPASLCYFCSVISVLISVNFKQRTRVTQLSAKNMCRPEETRA